MPAEARQVLRVDPASPRAARTLVRASLGGRPCISAAELAVSELVSNVVRHAPETSEVEVSVVLDAHSVRIEVAQQADGAVFPEHDVTAPWPQAERLDGRGLRIVDAVSRTWGVTADSRTVVWCEIEC